MSAQTLKEHLEIETLKALTYEQINNLMNEFHVENQELKRTIKFFKTSRPEIFSSVGQIILAKDVDIQKDLNGFKKFVVNGKMLQSTDRLFEELLKESDNE